MKIVLFCSSTLALPVLGELLTRNMVSGMVVPAVENEGVKRLQGIAGQYQVPLLIVQSHSMQETLAP